MFLSTMKDRCGNIALHWFMSNDADNILMRKSETKILIKLYVYGMYIEHGERL